MSDHATPRATLSGASPNYSTQGRGDAEDAGETEIALPLIYKDINLESGYRIDLLVEESVIAEIKTVAKVLPVHEAQLLTHLRLSGNRLGLLLNFYVPRMRDGIKRMVNRL